MNLLWKATGSLAAALLAAATVATYKPTASFQMGGAGVGMQVTDSRARLAEKLEANAIPPTLPAASPGGALAVDAYKNVQVLGHLSSGDFTRLMTAMTIWVSPEQGCAYCHAPQRDAQGAVVKNAEGYPLADINNMQSDELYTKRVARRMLQMTMNINGNWKQHVAETGVTCYTCHRGNPVPANIWFDQPDNAAVYPAVGPDTNHTVPSRLVRGPSAIADYSTLPKTPLRAFFVGDENIRVQATQPTGSDDRSSIKQAEWTYSLMLHMSNSLGVNCTYCHNSRSFGDWTTSPTTRTTAWHGIRMVRQLNNDYLIPLATLFPQERLGALGDGPKASCATCHAGAYKPLLGVSMLKDYPALAEAKPQPMKSAVPADSAGMGGTPGGAPPSSASAAAPPPGSPPIAPSGSSMKMRPPP